MQKTSKLISLILVLILALSVTTMTAFAKETESEKGEFTLTPDGNLTLIDDHKVTSESGEKEFIVIQSRSGEYFYLVIDRTGNTENVYFLNLVDETDLMKIISEIDPDFEPTIENVGSTTDETESNANSSMNTETEDNKTETQAQKSSSSSMMILAVFAILGIGGGVYYFKFSQPKGLPVHNEEADNDDEVFDERTEVVKAENDEENFEQSVEQEKSVDESEQVQAVNNVTKTVQSEKVKHGYRSVGTVHVGTAKAHADGFDFPKEESEEVELVDEVL